MSELHKTSTQTYNSAEEVPNVAQPCPDGAELKTISHMRMELRAIKSEVKRLIDEGMGMGHGLVEWQNTSQLLMSTIRPRKKQNGDNSEARDEPVGCYNNLVEELAALKFSHDRMVSTWRPRDHLRDDENERESWKQSQTESKLKEEISSLKQQNRRMAQQIESIRVLKQVLQKQLQLSRAQAQKYHELMAHLTKQNQSITSRLKQAQSFLRSIQGQFQKQTTQCNQLHQVLLTRQAEIHELRQKILRMAPAPKTHPTQHSPQKTKPYHTLHQLDGIHWNDSLPADKHVAILKGELEQRQRVMVLMLNDIKTMDKQLKDSEVQQMATLRLRKLIELLNECIVKAQAQRLSVKYAGPEAYFSN